MTVEGHFFRGSLDHIHAHTPSLLHASDTPHLCITPSLSTTFLLSDPRHKVQGLGEGVVNDSALPLHLAPAVGPCRWRTGLSFRHKSSCAFFGPGREMESDATHQTLTKVIWIFIKAWLGILWVGSFQSWDPKFWWVIQGESALVNFSNNVYVYGRPFKKKQVSSVSLSTIAAVIKADFGGGGGAAHPNNVSCSRKQSFQFKYSSRDAQSNHASFLRSVLHNCASQ